MEKNNLNKKRKFEALIDDTTTRKIHFENTDINESVTNNLEKRLKLDVNFELSQMESGISEKLDTAVNIMRFVKARKNEIKFITSVIETKLPKRVIQQLPRHMRRRAASHNPKRLPRRLRERAMKELEKVKKAKRPSRKFRRKPSKLLEEYNRRQRNHIWLETHIWFAKRFKMIDIWGYKLPLYSNEKCLKALYQSAMQYALLQDISYYGCIELSGKEETLLKQLSQLTNPELGLTFKSKIFLDGSREGTLLLFHQNSYPYGLIGPVKFFWKPQIPFDLKTEDQLRCLWLWVHPACIKELTDELIHLFELQLKVEKEPSEITYDRKRKLYFERINVYNKNDITLTILKDILVRHRLIGPLSQTVFTNSLELALEDYKISSENSNSKKWWENLAFESQIHHDLEEKKQFAWKKLINSVVKFLPGTIIGLTVRDPRILLPSKKVKNRLKDNHAYEEIIPTPELAYSYIWDSCIRDEVSSTKIPEASLNKIRSNNLMSNADIIEKINHESKIPLLMIYQSGNEDGYGNGIDIIIPSGWSMAFWIAFIYQGAKAGGLREVKNIGLESGLPIFPYNFPDSQSCKEMQEKRRLELMIKHYKYPPDKRPSFEKLGVIAPFFYPWIELVQEWKNYFNQNMITEHIKMVKSNFFVLRNRCYLKLLINLFSLKNTNKKMKKSKCLEINNEIFSSLLSKEETCHLQNSLVCVQLIPIYRGTPEEFSNICLPLEIDLRELKINQHYEGPIEPNHSKEYKKDHKKTKKNKSSKSAVKSDDCIDHKILKPEINNLFLSSTRKIIGYVEYGNYSFIQGKNSAIGHCSLIGILELLKRCSDHEVEPFALVKKQNSFQYRCVKIKVVL